METSSLQEETTLTSQPGLTLIWVLYGPFTKHNTKPSLPPQALIWLGSIEVHCLITTNGKCNTGSEHSHSCFLFPVKPVLYGWRENHFKCHILQRCSILQRSQLLLFPVCSLFVFKATRGTSCCDSDRKCLYRKLLVEKIIVLINWKIVRNEDYFCFWLEKRRYSHTKLRGNHDLIVKNN